MNRPGIVRKKVLFSFSSIMAPQDTSVGIMFENETSKNQYRTSFPYTKLSYIFKRVGTQVALTTFMVTASSREAHL